MVIMEEPVSISRRWFTVGSDAEFAVGARMHLQVGTGYNEVLDMARDARWRPHEQAASDVLEAECREIAEVFLTIAKEDGDARGIASAFRAMLIETSRIIEEGPWSAA